MVKWMIPILQFKETAQMPPCSQIVFFPPADQIIHWLLHQGSKQVQIPPESPVKVFSQTLGKHWVYSALHMSVQGKINQFFYPIKN